MDHPLLEALEVYKDKPDLANEILSRGVHGPVQFYSPDKAGEKYLRFCEKLALPEHPYLLVMPDKQVELKPGADTFGYFIPSGNLVVIAQSAFDLYQQDKPLGDYVMGHELGHAKSGLTRRSFMEKAAAYAGGAASFATTYGASTAISDAINGPIDPEKKPKLSYAATALKAVGSGMAGWITAKQIEAMFVLVEEFRADDGAAKVMARSDILDGMQQYLEDSWSKKSPEDFKDFKDEFAQAVAHREQQEGKPMDPDVKRYAWIKILGGGVQPKIFSLGAIFKPNYYPSMAERFGRLQTQEARENKGEPSR